MPSKKTPLSLLPLGVTLAVLAAGGCFLYRGLREGRPPAGPPPGVVQAPAAPEAYDTVVLSAAERRAPGARPTVFLRYRHPAATHVLVAGSWDRWATNQPMRKKDGLWEFDIRGTGAGVGRYEFKFLPDGAWEPGPNRHLFVNEQGRIEEPPDLVLRAGLEERDRIDILLKGAVEGAGAARVRLIPPIPVRETRWLPGRGGERQSGFALAGDAVVFCFDPAAYGTGVAAGDRVAVAGTFNGWHSLGGNGDWVLQREADGLWRRAVPRHLLAGSGSVGRHQFKFVINGSRWLAPPLRAPNAASDGRGNVNLSIDPSVSDVAMLRVWLDTPPALSNSYLVAIEDLAERTVYHPLTPGAELLRFQSRKALGAVLDPASSTTTFRLFAPRARSVTLCLFDGPEHAGATPRVHALALEPREGIWERTLPGLLAGTYYSFRVDGPEGPGEEFNGRAQVGDPYGRAAAHSDANSIVMDPAATNEWFGGWSDRDYRAPAPADLFLYECHVRDLTMDPSSGVAPGLRGTYEGLLATEGTGAGLDHLRAMGVNMIELMPIAEFSNGTNRYDWGYAPVFFFAPESSYGRDPARGSQYYEFKRLVNELHRRGFGVILDVVYNHVGSPNLFSRIDRKYYFRLDLDFRYSNYSRCGNDVRSEAPMMRRLIVDNVLYWMREFHVDGFRFDLAELIDMETLLAVRDAARAVNPNVILISEPWSYRGDHKQALRGTGWSAWNNEYRDGVRAFAQGRGDAAALRRAVLGSVDSWTATPLQSVNYLESHDDMSFADEMSSHPRRDGRELRPDDVRRNCLAATVLFTSLGIPMINAGQEFARSKQGRHNTFDGGDQINALRWTDRDRPLARETMEYYRALAQLRRSPAGASLRLGEPAPPGYCRWLDTADGRAAGYLLNADRARSGAAFAVLVNAADQPVRFEVPFPAGEWRLIANGRRVAVEGLPDVPAFAGGGTRAVAVPAAGAYVFMEGRQP